LVPEKVLFMSESVWIELMDKSDVGMVEYRRFESSTLYTPSTAYA